MKIGIRLFRASDSSEFDIGSLLSPVSLGLGALETGIGIVQDINAKKKINNLLDKQKAYHTPQEIYDILNATQERAQQGYDQTTLNYLTGQTDQAFSSGIDTLLKTNGDPNNLSALFNQKINSIMRIGAENHQLNTANFSQYINAMESVAANKAAEQKSQQDLIKNKLQAAGVQMNNATGNISGGINTILATLASEGQMNLYKTKQPQLPTYVNTNYTGYDPSLISANDLRTNSPINIGG